MSKNRPIRLYVKGRFVRMGSDERLERLERLLPRLIVLWILIGMIAIGLWASGWTP